MYGSEKTWPMVMLLSVYSTCDQTAKCICGPTHVTSDCSPEQVPLHLKVKGHSAGAGITSERANKDSLSLLHRLKQRMRSCYFSSKGQIVFTMPNASELILNGSRICRLWLWETGDYRAETRSGLAMLFLSAGRSERKPACSLTTFLEMRTHYRHQCHIIKLY